MIIGVPKEIKLQEHRIGLTPDSVKVLADKGHEILIQNNGGFEAGFTNEDYKNSGAKIINKAEDIHSLISFLGFEPLSDANIFRRAISNPIKEGCDIGLCRLRATMSHIALRRSKALTKIKLVEKEVFLTSISLQMVHTKIFMMLSLGLLGSHFEPFFK